MLQDLCYTLVRLGFLSMFLPLRCLVNLRLEASFVGLENGLEILSAKLKAYFTKSTSEDIYALLWELGSNVLKYGLKKSSQNSQNKISDFKNPCNAESAKSKKIDLEKIDSNKIHLQAFVYNDFVEISLHYKIGFALEKFSAKSNTKNAKSNMQKSATTFITTPPQIHSLHYYELVSHTKDVSHIDSNLFGNKVIAYLAEKICYDTPKIFFKNARERILRVRILNQNV